MVASINGLAGLHFIRNEVDLWFQRICWHSGSNCVHFIVGSPFRAKHHVVVQYIYGSWTEMSPAPLPLADPPPPTRPPSPLLDFPLLDPPYPCQTPQQTA